MTKVRPANARSAPELCPTSSHCSARATEMPCAARSISGLSTTSGRISSILARLRDGSMPCDGPWPEDRVHLFESWLDGGD